MIGVLGLQGDFAAHVTAFHTLGVDAAVVKKPEELNEVDGLVLPGGESTTLIKLMDAFDFWGPLAHFSTSGKPLFGTCAGMIMLAQNVVNPEQKSLGFIDITVERNSYGRQRDSFEAIGRFAPSGGPAIDIPMVFIRAPRIVTYGPHVKPVATCGGDMVMARQSNVAVASFHPELAAAGDVHRYFVEMVRASQQASVRVEEERANR